MKQHCQVDTADHDDGVIDCVLIYQNRGKSSETDSTADSHSMTPLIEAMVR